MKVVRKILNVDSGVITVVIEFHNGIELMEREFSSEIFNKYGAKVLLNYGIRFSEKDIDLVTQYLILSDSQADIIKVYSKLGWNIQNKDTIFRCCNAVNAEGILQDYYNGNIDIQPHGNLEKWLDMVNQEVLGNIPLTYVLILGFASPIISLLNKKYDLGTIIFSLSNTSSKGKTTAAMLASSVFANPIINRGTLISYNATENALIEFISSCHGYTVGLDEVAISNIKDFSKFMYAVCNGRSKMRLNSDSTAKEIKQFDSIIISTAEFDLISDNSPDGLRTRVFQINDALTTSADNSDHIKNTVIENYAVAGKKYIEYLIKEKLSLFQSDYEKHKQILLNKCENIKELTERILSKLAVISTAAQYVEECFSVDLQIERIIQYSLSLELEISATKNHEETLLEIIKQFAIKNHSKFVIEGRYPSISCLGAIVEYDEKIEIRIMDSVFLKIVKEYSITDYKQSLKKLKMIGNLITEEDRLYKRVKILSNSSRIKCYCFRINNGNDNIPSLIDEIKAREYELYLKKTKELSIDEDNEQIEFNF